MYLWGIYIFPGLVCLFFSSQIGRLILGIYKNHSQIHDWNNRERGRAVSFLGIHKSDFWYSVGCGGTDASVYSTLANLKGSSLRCFCPFDHVYWDDVRSEIIWVLVAKFAEICSKFHVDWRIIYVRYSPNTFIFIQLILNAHKILWHIRQRFCINKTHLKSPWSPYTLKVFWHIF